MVSESAMFEHELMPPFYGETHIQWRDALREFLAGEIAPFIGEWDEAGDVPLAAHRKCGEFGFTGISYPEAYGGVSQGIDIYHEIISAQEMARLGSGGVQTALGTHLIGLPPVLAFGREALKQRIAPDVIAGKKIIALAITEPSGGSDVAAIKTRAERKGDHYVVSGSKIFISSGMKADYYTVAVRTGGSGASGISILLLEKGMPGFSATPLKKQGWWASDTATLYFDEVEVPVENLVGVENAGFHVVMHNFNNERIFMSACAVSSARACLIDAVHWARERQTFGKRLADHQVIRHKLVEMYRKVSAAQAYLEHCAWRIQNGDVAAADIAVLKVQATRAMEYCAREASQVLGGASYVRGCRVERIYREVRVNVIGGGSEEIMRDLAAKQLGI
jgi:acyl-CoA dehydrogenase